MQWFGANGGERGMGKECGAKGQGGRGSSHSMGLGRRRGAGRVGGEARVKC